MGIFKKNPYEKAAYQGSAARAFIAVQVKQMMKEAGKSKEQIKNEQENLIDDVLEKVHQCCRDSLPEESQEMVEVISLTPIAETEAVLKMITVYNDSGIDFFGTARNIMGDYRKYYLEL